MIKQNVPYRKELVNGIVTNPITKENPYIHNRVRVVEFYRMWHTVRNKFFTGRTIINPS